MVGTTWLRRTRAAAGIAGTTALAIVALAVAPAHAGLRSPWRLRPGNQPTVCGLFTGDHYAYSANGGARISGDRYGVDALGLSCAAARSWAAKFTYDDPKVPDKTGIGGDVLYTSNGSAPAAVPAGYTCRGKSYTYSRHAPPTISGACLKGTSLAEPSGLLEWAVAPTSE